MKLTSVVQIFDIRQVLLNSFRGKNIEIDKSIAMNMFLSHMERDEERANPIFLLKHLYIMDQTVEEKIALDHIAGYYSSQFFMFKNGTNIQITPIRQLIANYFTYIKKKAEIYNDLDLQYFGRKDDRQKLINDSKTSDIFILVDKCFQIQKQINKINQKYKGRNKSVELIKMIFTMLLKTYLFCYSLVSLSIKNLFSISSQQLDRISKLSKPEVIKMNKLILHYNKDYIKNFIDFVESNKGQIEIFGNIKYSEIIRIKQIYISYIENLIANMDIQPSAQFKNISIEEENNILSLPETVYNNLLEEMKVIYRPRRQYELLLQKQLASQEQFYNYQSLYAEQYDSEFQVSLRHNYSSNELKLAGNVNLEGSRKINIKRVEYDQINKSQPFSQNIWSEWKNIYAN